MAYATVLLQEIVEVEGRGLRDPEVVTGLSYTVPQGATAGIQYVRAGNTAPGMVNVTILRDGVAIRHFPVAAGGTTHVPLAIVDDLQPGTEVGVSVAGESGSGLLILDIGILEVTTG